MAKRDHGVIALLKIIIEEWGLNAEQQREILKPLEDIFRIATDLDALYKDKEVVKKFLNTPQASLDNCTPLYFMMNGNIARVKIYVAYLSGR